MFFSDISKTISCSCYIRSTRYWKKNNLSKWYLRQCSWSCESTNCEAFSHHCNLSFLPLCSTSQAQFTHIGASLHTRTPFSFRVPAGGQPVFLLVNILYAVVPQALCYRCCTRPAFFLRTTPEKKTEWRSVSERERECQRCQGCLNKRLKYLQSTALCLQLLAVAIFGEGASTFNLNVGRDKILQCWTEFVSSSLYVLLLLIL